MTVVILSDQSSNTRDVTWEVDLVSIIAATPDAGKATGPETLGPDLSIRYLRLVVPPVPLVPPVSSVPPVPPVLPVPPVPPGLPGTPAPPRRLTVPPVMTPVMSPAPPMVPPPPGVMLPSSSPGTDNPQVDEGHLEKELSQPGRTRGRTRACHQASTAARSADHAIYNQPTPALPTCDASQLSGPAPYHEAMRSPYHANCSHAMEGEIGGLEEAGTSGDA